MTLCLQAYRPYDAVGVSGDTMYKMKKTIGCTEAVVRELPKVVLEGCCSAKFIHAVSYMYSRMFQNTHKHCRVFAMLSKPINKLTGTDRQAGGQTDRQEDMAGTLECYDYRILYINTSCM